MKKNIMLGVVMMILLAGCKKNDEAISLQGKWVVENSITKYYQNGNLVNTVNETFPGLKWEFNSDGNLIRRAGLSADSTPYTITSDSKVNIGGEIFEIRDLTRSAVTLVNKAGNTPGTYTEVSLNLKR